MNDDKKKILIVTTNTSALADGTPTGIWLEEFAVPFLIFKATGYDVTVASPKGGDIQIDEMSLSCSNPMEWDDAAAYLKNTEVLNNVDYSQYDVVFFPGGHGPVFDIAQDRTVAKIVEDFYKNGKIVSAVCHGPVGLIQALDENGEPIVKGKKVTSFTDEEEYIMKRAELIPFLIEDTLKELGADFIEAKPWTEHVEVDGNIITGQNPASAIAVAEQIVKKLS